MASEFSPATATKPSANHGITMRPGGSGARGGDGPPAGNADALPAGGAWASLPRWSSPHWGARDKYVDRMIRNGASIMTRTILVMTAVLAAASAIALPAATTCATS